MASEECAKLSASLGIDEALASLAEVGEQIPLGLDVLTFFGGRDLAVAGKFRGTEMADADWAVYGTLHWTGKLGIELLKYPGLLDLESQGIEVEVAADHVILRGGNLPRELYLSRVKDVGLISTSVEFVEKAHSMAAREFEDSMLMRAEYGDYVRTIERSNARDEIEGFVQMRRLFENFQLSGAWPDANSISFLPAFLGKFFQSNTINLAVGTIGFDEGLKVQLHGQLSSELMTPLQERAFRRKGADRDEILNQAAILAPQDASLFVYLRGDVGDLLDQVLASLEPTAVELLEEAMQSTGRYPQPRSTRRRARPRLR